MTHQSIFITGTDTHVGKTTITAALLLTMQRRNQSVGILKPFETGVDIDECQHSDTERLRRLVDPIPSFESVCLYPFPQPLAPLSAAYETGTIIDFSRIHLHIQELATRYSFLLIEGAGGIFTPITPKQTIRDLITFLNVSCLIVGRTDLGGFNHCRLTVEALQQANIPLCGIALNTTNSSNTAITIRQQQSTIELIKEWAPVPVFGPIDFVQKVHTHWKEGVNQLAEHTEIQRLAIHLKRLLNNDDINSHI